MGKDAILARNLTHARQGDSLTAQKKLKDQQIEYEIQRKEKEEIERGCMGRAQHK
jgi:hypothetical protein